MKTLFTGSAGFLGQHIYKPFVREGHRVVLSDVAPISAAPDASCGDLADEGYVRELVRDVDSIVIAHMSPRREISLARVCDTMIKGTMNLLQAASESKASRVCLISSVDAVKAHPPDMKSTGETQPAGIDLYGLAKACQEILAEHYCRTTGLGITALRIGYVVDAKTRRDKYDNHIGKFTQEMIDRQDVGEAALRSLATDQGTWRVFHVLGSMDHPRYDTQHTWSQLGFYPRHLGAGAPEIKPIQAMRAGPSPAKRPMMPGGKAWSMS